MAAPGPGEATHRDGVGCGSQAELWRWRRKMVVFVKVVLQSRRRMVRTRAVGTVACGSAWGRGFDICGKRELIQALVLVTVARWVGVLRAVAGTGSEAVASGHYPRQ